MFNVICANSSTEYSNKHYDNYDVALEAAMVAAQTGALTAELFNSEPPYTAIVNTDTGEVIEML